MRRLGLANALEKAGRALHWNEAEELAHLEAPARVRRALEEMGPTFIKLGQVLATRVDLFDATWIAEFSRLQDERANCAMGRNTCAAEQQTLGAAPEEIFACHKFAAIGRSIHVAQVHRARLEDGTARSLLKYVVPGIRPVDRG